MRKAAVLGSVLVAALAAACGDIPQPFRHDDEGVPRLARPKMTRGVTIRPPEPTPEGRARYLELAAMLKPLLSGFEGFVRAERFESLADHSKLLSMNVWTDEAAVSRWRNTLKHRLAQKEGRGKLIES